MISLSLPVGTGVLQFDDLRLAEIDRHQAVLEALLDGGRGHKEGLQVAEGGRGLAQRLPAPPQRRGRYLV